LSARPVPLTGAARFSAAMNVRPCARSPHFFLHHVAATKLSTGSALTDEAPVDDSGANGVVHHLGMVVPKRHARRSVTRSLVKRHIREGVRRHVTSLPAGDWVLRLRAPLDRVAYPSASSPALSLVVRDEIERLLLDAVERLSRPARSAPK
jgi:ribonuclease P protein component